MQKIQKYRFETYDSQVGTIANMSVSKTRMSNTISYDENHPFMQSLKLKQDHGRKRNGVAKYCSQAVNVM